MIGRVGDSGRGWVISDLDPAAGARRAPSTASGARPRRREANRCVRGGGRPGRQPGNGTRPHPARAAAGAHVLNLSGPLKRHQHHVDLVRMMSRVRGPNGRRDRAHNLRTA